jgi:hypothetical protein
LYNDVDKPERPLRRPRRIWKEDVKIGVGMEWFIWLKIRASGTVM